MDRRRFPTWAFALAALAVGVGAFVGMAAVVTADQSSPYDVLDPIGARAAAQFERGAGIETTSIDWAGASYPVTFGDGAGGVMFGGASPACNRDDSAFVYTASGRPSVMWPEAERVSDHWFRTNQCVSVGI